MTSPTAVLRTLVLTSALIAATACQSSGPSQFPDQNRSLHGELEALLQNVAAVDGPARNSLAIFKSLIDGTYAGQAVVGVQEFGGSIEAIETYRKTNLKKQTAQVRSLWKTVSSGKASRIKVIKQTDPAKAAKQTAELDREGGLFQRVEESVDPLLTQLEEIQTALTNTHLVAELDFSPRALADLSPDVAKIEAMVNALAGPRAASMARTEEFQAEFAPFVIPSEAPAQDQWTGSPSIGTQSTGSPSMETQPLESQATERMPAEPPIEEVPALETGAVEDAIEDSE